VEYALTPHALSKDFQRRLEEVLGSRPIYLDYAELRKLSPRSLLARLSRLGASRLLLPVEDESSRCLLPLLKGLAAFTHARAIEIVNPDLKISKVSRLMAGRSIVDVLAATVTGSRDLAVCRTELDGLVRLPRLALPGWDRIVADRDSVLYIDASLWFGMKSGGSVVHVAGVANALLELGHPVTLASAVGRTLIRPDVGSVPLKVPSVFGLPFEKSYYTFHRSIVPPLETFYRRAAPGFIYQRMSGANYAGVTLSRRWQVPLVLEYNGSAVWIGRNWGNGFRHPGVALQAEAACLRHAQLVVTVSDVLVDELVERGVSRERIVSYPNCVDANAFDPAKFPTVDGHALRASLNISPDAPVVTFIGTFGQWHGVEVFAQAIRDLVDRHRGWLDASGVRFVLVGDGPNMPVVRRLLSPEPYASFVALTGLVPQADAPRYLAMSDVVVSPHVKNQDGSRFFGSPTKLFEYMAMGKAIVASDLEQIGTVLKAGIHCGELPSGEPPADERRLAVLCEPGNAEMLGDALRFIVGKPVWRAVLGANARAEVLAKYTWGHHVSAILNGVASISTNPHHE
jgi:glycosyltransferase involved in cell wall biosynthesis